MRSAKEMPRRHAMLLPHYADYFAPLITLADARVIASWFVMLRDILPPVHILFASNMSFLFTPATTYSRFALYFVTLFSSCPHACLAASHFALLLPPYTQCVRSPSMSPFSSRLSRLNSYAACYARYAHMLHMLGDMSELRELYHAFLHTTAASYCHATLPFFIPILAPSSPEGRYFARRFFMPP